MPSLTHHSVRLKTPLSKAKPGQAWVGMDCSARESGLCVLYKNRADLYEINTKPLTGIQRLDSLYYMTAEALSQHNDSTLMLGAIEDGLFVSPGRVFLAGQAHGTMIRAARRAGLRLLLAHLKHIKQFFTLSAGADKKKMVKYADQELDFSFDHNVKSHTDLADAYACAKLAYAKTTHDVGGRGARRRMEILVEYDPTPLLEDYPWLTCEVSELQS